MRGICGLFFLQLSTSRSQVVTRKSHQMTSFLIQNEYHDVTLTLSNQTNLLRINLKIVLCLAWGVCTRIFEMRPNFLKHSQNSHYDYNDPTFDLCALVSSKRSREIFSNFFGLRIHELYNLSDILQLVENRKLFYVSVSLKIEPF